MAPLGAELLLETLEGWELGNITPKPQDDSLATKAPLIKKDHARIDWDLKAHEIECRIRAFIPWPVAYAHTFDDSMAGQDGVQIAVAEDSVAPTWTAFGKAIGGVTPGDLFYIDSNNNTTDMLATLHITNTDALIHRYRYLILNVGIYVQTGTDQWEKATRGNGELLPDTYVTMSNGKVSFNLPGYAKYKITIDKGCFYCYGTDTDENAVSPSFYLDVG